MRSLYDELRALTDAAELADKVRPRFSSLSLRSPALARSLALSRQGDVT